MDYKPVIIGIVVILLVGLISIFTTFFGFFVQIVLGTSAILIGGLFAAYTTDGDYKDGGVNGAMSGIFSGALLGVLLLGLTFQDFSFSAIIAGLAVGGIMFGFNFGIIGAVMGNEIKNYHVKTGKDNDYLVCNKCGGYYELKEGESPEDFDVECDCGGKFAYKKSIKSGIRFSFLNRVFGVGVINCLIGAIMVVSVNGEQYLLNDFFNRVMLKMGLFFLLFGIMIICASIVETWE